MKKILLLLFLLPLLAIGKYPETSINSSIDTLPNRFPSIDSAKNYSLRYVKNSAVESFTNLRMQNVVYGTLQLLDSLCGTGAIDTIYKSGDTLKYKIGSQVFTVGVFGGSSLDTTSLSNRINLKLNISDTSAMLTNYRHWTQGYLTAVPTLQQVTNQGFTTTTDILKTDGFGRKLVETRGSVSQGQLRIFNPLESGGENNHTTYGRHGIAYIGNVNTGAAIQYPDTTGIGQRFVIGAKLNGTAFFPSIGGFIDLGTITATPDSLIFATRFWVNSNFVATGSSASLQNLNITGTNGNGHIHLRHQATLPTATGQSTTIYANSLGNFAWKNDGNYHTTLKTDANTADRTYTFQNKDYTVADNAEVVKYTDTLALLDGRISSITLNTSGAIHTNPITFSRVGGAWSGTMSLTTQSANRVFAGPTTGSPATPTFRSLVDADIPSTSKGVQWRGVDSTFAYQQAKNGFHELIDFNGQGGPLTNSTIPGTTYGTNAITLNGITDVNAFGIAEIKPSPASTYGFMYHGVGASARTWIVLDANPIWLYYRIRIPNLADGSNDFSLTFGLQANLGTGALSNAVCLAYMPTGAFNGSASSGNWQIMTASASNRTWTTTSTAVPSNTWTTIAIRATSTRIDYFVDGVNVGSITNNIPTVALYNHIQVLKVNGSSARGIDIDFLTIDKVFSR